MSLRKSVFVNKIVFLKPFAAICTLFYVFMLLSCKQEGRNPLDRPIHQKVLKPVTLELDTSQVLGHSLDTFPLEGAGSDKMRSSFLKMSTAQGNLISEEIRNISLPVYIPQDFLVNSITGKSLINIFQGQDYYTASQTIEFKNKSYKVELFGTKQGYFSADLDTLQVQPNEDKLFSYTEEGAEMTFQDMA